MSSRFCLKKHYIMLCSCQVKVEYNLHIDRIIRCNYSAAKIYLLLENNDSRAVSIMLTTTGCNIFRSTEMA